MILAFLTGFNYNVLCNIMYKTGYNLCIFVFANKKIRKKDKEDG